MGSIKSVIRIILIVAVLLLFTTCGIPRMFRWDRNNEYTISSSEIHFDLSYTSDGETHRLEAKNGFPQLHFFYAIAPQVDISSGNAYERLASSFNSRYSDSPVNTTSDISRHDPLITVTVYPNGAAGSTTTSSVIGLYEFINVDADGAESRPSFPNRIDDFPVDTQSGYDRYITYLADVIPYGNGYAIQLTLNQNSAEPRVYTLIRNNGEPFMTNINYYIEEQGNSEIREFEYGDAASYFQMASIYVYATCTFAFNGYTSVYTIPLTRVGNEMLIENLASL